MFVQHVHVVGKRKAVGSGKAGKALLPDFPPSVQFLY